MTGDSNKRRVLFLVEGFTDIRFVKGLSEVCDLTLAIPSEPFEASGLKQRIQAADVKLDVIEFPGGRSTFPLKAAGYLMRSLSRFDVVVAQEVTRGAFVANVAGKLRGRPVYNYMGIAPVEYFACRWERRSLPWWKYRVGDAVIRTLLTMNGALATGWLAMGPYLQQIGRRYCANTQLGLYYGVDTEQFRPASVEERRELRRKRDLPQEAFLIFLSSRISHEKDPETVLRATALVRKQGLNAVLLNLGGGYQEFLDLAERLELPDANQWVIGRPAVNPLTEVSDYFRAADAMALASLAEGAAYSTLEALSCGTPVVATAVGGMAVQLEGWARLSPRQDPQGMADQLLWVATHSEEARAQAFKARQEYIIPQWDRRKAFEDMRRLFEQASPRANPPAAREPLPSSATKA